MKVTGPSLDDLDRLGADFAGQVASVVEQVGKHARADLTANATVTVDDVARIPTWFAHKVDDVLLRHVAAAYWHGVDHVAGRVGEQSGAIRASVADDMQDPGAVYELPRVTSPMAEQRLANARNRLVNVGTAVWGHARDALVAGQAAGLGVTDLAAAVHQATRLAIPRAEVIARTEVNGAANAGAIDQVRAFGVKAHKQWLATSDARTREDHADADGQIVELSQKFVVGGERMDHPHDPGASAAQTVDCRCTETFDVDDDGVSALTGSSVSGGGSTYDGPRGAAGAGATGGAGTGALTAGTTEQGGNTMTVTVTEPSATLADSTETGAPQWRGVLIVEGTATGDGREFATESIGWPNPTDVPMALQWQKETNHGSDHDVTVSVGRIDRVWRDGNKVMGEGRWDTHPDALEAQRRNSEGFLNGVSINADDITDADVEYVMPDNGEEDAEDDDFLAMIFAKPEKTIFHAARLRSVTLCDIPAYVEAQIHPVDPATEALVASVAAPPRESIPAQLAIVTERAADGLAEWHPPAAWFTDPELKVATPIIVTGGRVYGLASEWGECHIGFGDQCILPPREDYHDRFMTGTLTLGDGSVVAVGQITAGIGHAPLSATAAAAAEHYDNTDAVVADVIVGNSKAGIWVAGAIRPWADPARVHALRASGQVSPDWRSFGGRLRMVGLLAVNVSGFQVPRIRQLVAGGQVVARIGEGLVSVKNPVPSAAAPINEAALRALQAELHRKVHGNT